MITDVFAADPASLAGYAKAGFPDPVGAGYETVRARGFEPVTLALLDSLLSKEPFETALADATMTPDDEPDLFVRPVVTALSSRTVRLLPAVEDDDLTSLAEDWSTFAELTSFTPEALRGWLADVQEICRNAAYDGHLVFVWNSL
jgi:hypothetical protein